RLCLSGVGRNAIALAVRAATEIGAVQEALRARPDPRWQEAFPDAPYTTFNFGTISGGTAANMIAEGCRLRVSYRPLPDADPLAPYEAVRARLAALAPHDFGSPLRGEGALGAPTVVPGMLSPRDSGVERALGGGPRPATRSYAARASSRRPISQTRASRARPSRQGRT